MSKYTPLQKHLEKSNYKSIPMTFEDIEHVIGFGLPASSRTHRAWWSNNPTNNVMTKAWLEAGYVTADVNLAAEKLTFCRAPESEPAKSKKRQPQQLFGFLKDTVTIAEGTDLTKPADLEWANVYE